MAPVPSRLRAMNRPAEIRHPLKGVHKECARFSGRLFSARSFMAGAGLLALLVALATGAAPAHADITVRATVNPPRAQVGEAISLLIDIGGAQNVAAPALSAIDGFDLQYVGPSTQISIVNGQMNASIQHRYSLLPMRQGHFTIGPFTVDYQGKQYTTAPVGVDIVAAPQPGQAPGGQTQGQPGAPGANAPRALRVTIAVPKQEVYLHERVPVDVTLYIGSIRVADVNYPTLPADGLSLDKFPQPSQTQQAIDGENFQVIHFQTTVIPLRSGPLPLGPAVVHLNVLNRRRDQGFNDPFFERFFQDDPFSTERRPLDVRSDPLTLTVLPLPDEGKPAGFSGAVGTFTMQVAAAPRELNAGDPITMHVALNGSGNLADSAAPELTNAEGFRTYEAHAGKSEPSGTSVNKTFEQVLIPNDASVHAIPPVRFTYFDPQLRSYRQLQSEPIALVVRAPKNAPQAEIVAGGALVPRARPEEKLGRDIVYIKDDPGALRARARPWYGSAVFLLWQPVPLLLFIGAVWYDRRRQRLSGDLRYARFTRAGKEARRGLGAAEHAMTQGDRQGFYDAVSRAMQTYLAAKLDLPPGGIDVETVRNRRVPADCVQRLADFFSTCEQVRFAPSPGDGDMRGTLALAQEVIKRLERERRLAPNGAPSPAPAAAVTDGRSRGGAAALLLLALWPCPARAVEAPASPQTSFFHANALYKDGQYATAAQEYEQLLQAGLESGNVYFNLANAYFKAGEKGKAILNYERARRCAPSDPDVAANLTYAQSQTGADACVPALWQRFAFPLAHRVATSGLLWMTSAVYTLLLIALATYRLWPRRPRWLVYAAGAIAVVVVVATTSLAQQVLTDESSVRAVIIGSGDTPARFEPADNGTVHFALKEGTLVRVLDIREGWLQIARCDGLRGWVEKKALEAL